MGAGARSPARVKDNPQEPAKFISVAERSGQIVHPRKVIVARLRVAEESRLRLWHACMGVSGHNCSLPVFVALHGAEGAGWEVKETAEWS